MKSVLPDALEAKRKLVIKDYNKAVFLLAGGLYGTMLVCSMVLLHRPDSISPQMMTRLVLGFLVLVLLPAQGYGFYRLVKQSDERCRRVGFICPHCGKPLYEPKGLIHLTGRCPKCQHGLTIATIRQDERVRLSKLRPTLEPGVAEGRFTVGTRVRFLKLVAIPQENSPAFIYAEPGEAGEVQGYATEECYWTVADGRSETFLAWPDEFEAI